MSAQFVVSKYIFNDTVVVPIYDIQTGILTCVYSI